MEKKHNIEIVRMPYEAGGKPVLTVYVVQVDEQMVLSTAIKTLADFCKEMVEHTLNDPSGSDWFEVNIEELRKAFAESKVLEPANLKLTQKPNQIS